MAVINILDSSTIDKIAAGEVVERPLSVVKELVENAMDAGADAVTVEIRDGGCSFIRVTDNGSGIEKEQIRKAFFRHATSKIHSAEDLFHIHSLGFRGEALSSIAAVSMMELITKTEEQLTGVHYRLEGGAEKELEEVGAPEGTTMIVRELFYNTPVRKKFLKSPAAEGSYISDLMEHMALSRPDVAFQFMVNGNVKFHTSGNGDLREIIYRIYGRQIVQELIPFFAEGEGISFSGFLGSPSVVRSNRNFEFFFVNGRYIRSPLLAKGLEAGYKTWLMQHKFPFALLHVNVAPENIDVNVHPSKMEVRFHDQPGICAFLEEQVRSCLRSHEMIPAVRLDEGTFGKGRRESSQEERKGERQQGTREEKDIRQPRQQECPAAQAAASVRPPAVNGLPKASAGRPAAEAVSPSVPADPSAASQPLAETGPAVSEQAWQTQKPSAAARPVSPQQPSGAPQSRSAAAARQAQAPRITAAPQPFETNRRRTFLQEEAGQYQVTQARQLQLFEDKLLSPESAEQYRILGQVFDTYWILQYGDKLMFIDQHAAHEKIKYEALVKKLRSGGADSQLLTPPLILNLSAREARTLNDFSSYFTRMGFEIEDFGGNAVAVRAVPCDLYGHYEQDFLLGILDELEEEPPRGTPSIIEEKLASMACKAAVKGNHAMSEQELKELVDQLLTLENPYHCPHGRPTIITMSRYELEKKFKRIV